MSRHGGGGGISGHGGALSSDPTGTLETAPLAAASTQRDMRVTSLAFLHAWFISDGYLYDWLTALAAIVITFAVPTYTLQPVDRFFLADDPTLSYPPHASTVSNTVLWVLVTIPPSCTVCLAAWTARSFHDGHHGLLTLLEAFALACGWKRWMNLVGVYRPSWLAVYASGDAADMEHGRLSYPSGHSAYMFSSMTVISLFLMGHLRVASRPRPGQFALSIACLVPVMLSTFVAVTRVYDYKHAPADINAGMFVGLASGVFAYLLNYPHITDSRSGLPRARSWSTAGLAAVPAAPKRSSDGL